MYREFYLWANSSLHMSPKVMKRVREKISDKIRCFDENTYEEILKDLSLDKHVIARFKKYPYSKEDMLEKEDTMKKMNISYITIDDEEFPEKLREIYDPPYILYYIGDINLLNNLSIAVVGARNATDYGKNVSKILVKDIADEGIVIVSGMAKGIDSYAHIFCMERKTPTIAVMGTSIEKTYPKSSIKLKKEIIENGGLVLSEYYIGTNTIPIYFAMRNRIISGLSEGVVLIEAKEKSGALITMDCALQQNRNVYAVPGSIFSEMSKGCHNMILEGAKIVRNSKDILEDFYTYPNNKSTLNKNNNKKIYKKSGKITSTCVNIRFDDVDRENISEEEIFIIKTLKSKGVLDIDELSVITRYELTDLIYYINKLVLEGFVVEVGFNRYAPNIIR